MVTLLITLAIALLLCSIGFKNYVYFISIGYGLAVAGMGVYLTIVGAGLPAIILIVYGIRLAGYITYREVATTYNKKMKGEIKDGKTVPMGVKIALWISVSAMYVCMVSPVSFRIVSGFTEHSVMTWVGVAISVFGFVFEAIADVQKQMAKKKDPKRFVDTGLYKIVRCPNYLGEMLFWTGVLLAGIEAYTAAWHWVVAIIGYVLIIYTMFSGARRLEVRQNRVYKESEEYWKYHDTTPIMVPFIPLYSVEKHKWLVL
ncbi:MAG: DUF1295 domain-containing protein [Saccharofermentans sp.]|nr:DUF1295 domain-containing protein [Saccharofermentans sp.]